MIVLAGGLPSSEIVSLFHIISVTLTFSRNLKGAGFGRRPFFAATTLVAQKSRLRTNGIFNGK
jgi:hypothetical protein